MVISLRDVLEDPARCCRVLQDDLFGVTVQALRTPNAGGVVVDLNLTPPPEFAATGYNEERARVSVRPDGGVFAFPLGPERTWEHRYPSPLGAGFGHLAGQLCLYYPRDPRHLRWEWGDGLEQYVGLVHRHLVFEEFNRREGRWPVEDAPHGEPTDGTHPIRSAAFRQKLRNDIRQLVRDPIRRNPTSKEDRLWAS